jgi:hypothetical protein
VVVLGGAVVEVVEVGEELVEVGEELVEVGGELVEGA